MGRKGSLLLFKIFSFLVTISPILYSRRKTIFLNYFCLFDLVLLVPFCFCFKKYEGTIFNRTLVNLNLSIKYLNARSSEVLVCDICLNRKLCCEFFVNELLDNFKLGCFKHVKTFKSIWVFTLFKDSYWQQNRLYYSL